MKHIIAMLTTILLAKALPAFDQFAPCRVVLGSRDRCGTRPGTLLRKDIPVRTEHWEEAITARWSVGMAGKNTSS